MTEHTSCSDNSRLLTEHQKAILREGVLIQACEESPRAREASAGELENFIDLGIAMIDEFERAAKPHPEIHADTDVVYVDSGPGPYSVSFPPYENKPDNNYHNYAWSRKMDRARIRAGVVLVAETTAKRLGKPAKDVTVEDILEDGPWLQYAATTWENNHVKAVFDELRQHGILKVPESRILMYDGMTDSNGIFQPIVHTAEQIRFLHFPEGLVPRRFAIVSHPAHLVRILHTIEQFKDRISKDTVIQPFPLPTPPEGIFDYAKLELLGTVAGIYRHDPPTASTTPHTYTL